MNSPHPSLRWIRFVAAFSLALSTATSALALDLVQTPLFIPTPLNPNLVVTLDDSGSMARAYVPDAIDSISEYRRFKSAAFNPVYFNPETTYLPAVDVNGSPRASCSNATSPLSCMETTYINGFNASRGTRKLATDYRPTSSYTPSSISQSFARNPAADFPGNETKGVAAYYYTYNGGTCTTSDDACYTKVDVTEAQYRNFSNWYAFYRTRNLMTMTGASRAFAGLDDNIRIAWQALNSCKSFDTLCTAEGDEVNNGIRQFSGTHRTNFYSWLSRLPASGGTALRSAFGRAGTYYTTSGIDSPYAENPYVTRGTEYSCRPNFHIAMTDGMWNGTFSTPIDDDEESKTLPDGRDYDPDSTLSRVFKSSSSGNVADIAFHFWSNDLRTDLANDLPPYFPDKSDASEDAQYWNPRNDPATWQHMVNFTVGLGLSASLGGDWENDTFAGGFFTGLREGTKTWPATGADYNPGNVFDLWHAAINSRGQFFSADDPRGLAEAFERALNRVMAKSSSAAALAANSTRVRAGTAVFQARFDSTTWSGDLYSIPLNKDGSTASAAWNAAAQVPRHGERRIYTWGGTAGVPFTFDGLSASQREQLTLNAGIQRELIDYLRGDASNEQPSGLGFRRRIRATSVKDATKTAPSPLGDIINSDPAFVGLENFGYQSLNEGLATSPTPYDQFVLAKAERPQVVYAGANDGMLHAFHAGLSNAADVASLIGTGQELFAYVPNALIPQLAALADPNYAHRYYVDGPPFSGDAFVGGAWKTMLVGSLGAGGKAVFALDVTDPENFSATKVHWEFTHDELGHSMGKPTIARLANGKWVAVFGNGPNSQSGTAKLFLVDLTKKTSDTWTVGTDYWILDTDNTLTANGLSEPTLYDKNNDKIIDYIYAGDLQGNVWKFDVTGDGTSGSLLFSASNDAKQKQPITSAIEIGVAPPGQNGVMLYFGTGRFYANGDNLDTENNKTQSFYGLHDDFQTTELDRSALTQQHILFEGQNPNPEHQDDEIRLVSDNTVSYDGQNRGWYLDLIYNRVNKGERVISAPLLRFGRVIFTTLIPSTDPCDFGGDGWLMELDAITGGRLSYSVFDLDQNRRFDAGDYVNLDGDKPVSGQKSRIGIIKTPAVISAGETEYKLMSGTSGEVQVISEKGGKMTGRISWREIFNR